MFCDHFKYIVRELASTITFTHATPAKPIMSADNVVHPALASLDQIGIGTIPLLPNQPSGIVTVSGRLSSTVPAAHCGVAVAT
jgi:hypothetical protein